jgi:uncharacterized RDD family membrane protein YckC
MPSAQPHLAPWERRLVAASIDTMLIFLSLAVLLGATEAVGISSMPVVLAAAPVLFTIYHSAALLHPQIGVGRTVAGVTVLSVRNAGQLTSTQAIVRPVVRIALVAVSVIVGIEFSQPWFIALPVVAELALIAHTSWRQSLADLICGTIVVRSPPLQPHRAPAVPMYSADDREFGPRP